MTRLPSLQPPIGFAHRGASAHARENTLDAFTLAVRLGASGLESDVWLTSDGVAVLDHDGLLGRRPRRRPIASVTAGELPPHIPSLADLYATVGIDLDLSLDVKDPDAAVEVIASARDVGAEGSLWLCHPDRELLVTWRDLSPHVHLVESIRADRFVGGAETHLARSASMGVDVINLHHTDWTGGLIAMAHRFGLLAFGWDAQYERVLDELLDSGIDGVYSDHVDRMTAAIVALG